MGSSLSYRVSAFRVVFIRAPYYLGDSYLHYSLGSLLQLYYNKCYGAGRTHI